MLDELADITRYLGDIRARYDRPGRDGGDRELGQLLAEEMLCEALRQMALTPESAEEVARLVAEFRRFSFARVPVAVPASVRLGSCDSSAPRSPTSPHGGASTGR